MVGGRACPVRQGSGSRLPPTPSLPLPGFLLYTFRVAQGTEVGPTLPATHTEIHALQNHSIQWQKRKRKAAFPAALLPVVAGVEPSKAAPALTCVGLDTKNLGWKPTWSSPSGSRASRFPSSVAHFFLTQDFEAVMNVLKQKLYPSQGGREGEGPRFPRPWAPAHPSPSGVPRALAFPPHPRISRGRSPF